MALVLLTAHEVGHSVRTLRVGAVEVAGSDVKARVDQNQRSLRVLRLLWQLLWRLC